VNYEKLQTALRPLIKIAEKEKDLVSKTKVNDGPGMDKKGKKKDEG
jgi:hypothetical protein